MRLRGVMEYFNVKVVVFSLVEMCRSWREVPDASIIMEANGLKYLRT